MIRDSVALTFHRHDGNGCGLDGSDCHPFDNLTIPIRCSASCRDTLLQEPYPIGGIEAVYTPLVIGGVGSNGIPIYRADSLICQAAIHAGVVSNNQGGCSVVSLIGASDSFLPSYHHEIQSYGFNTSFPKAFTFLTNIPNDCDSADIRWQMLIIAVLYTSIFSLFVSSPSVFFYPIFLVLFLFVSIISDPPDVPDYATRFSILVSRLVPTAFIAFVYYKYTISRTLTGLRCQVEKTILWLGGAWIGALNNYTFKDIPIQRLTPHDLGQAGAIPALITIILLLLAIAFGQAYFFWLEHRFRRYLALYTTFITILLLGVVLPTHHVRIHHYLLAMLFLPGTSLQTRPSLFYQGLLIGLFLNGIARWGFAPLLETSAMLFAGGPESTPLPLITSTLSPDLSSITFSWSSHPPAPDYTGLSILINDIEKYKWFTDNPINTTTFSYSRHETSKLETEYFRFAYIHARLTNREYTRAGVWDVNGSWSGIPGGDESRASTTVWTKNRILGQSSTSLFPDWTIRRLIAR